MNSGSRTHQRGIAARKRMALKKAFQKADKNGDGYLTLDEYVTIFRQEGYGNVTKREIERMFDSKDRDRDGRLSFKEFCGKWSVDESEPPAVSSAERALKAMDLRGMGIVAKINFLDKAAALEVKSRSHTNLAEACRAPQSPPQHQQPVYHRRQVDSSHLKVEDTSLRRHRRKSTGEAQFIDSGHNYSDGRYNHMAASDYARRGTEGRYSLDKY